MKKIIKNLNNYFLFLVSILGQNRYTLLSYIRVGIGGGGASKSIP